MTTTANLTTCPAFCISTHDEAPGVDPVHLDQDSRVEATNGCFTVSIEQAESGTAMIWVGDLEYTPAQADALIDAISARVYMLGATR